MKRVAFRMQIRPGTVAEYKRRHDEIWPELNELLRTSGISDYTIFLEEASLQLFAVQKLADNHTTDQLSQNPLVKKWCEYMSDIVLMDSSGDPICTPLPEMYHLD
ncbi:L-rhamnose mutarotase [Pirellulales bacterium]|nr:L-rhamnose mutarotase [Pirellulales bacterium]